jgi:2-C-methyl-D-erythritol 4-phosphate cytidylyltransferase
MPHPKPLTAAIIVGAGRGTRFGADDKVLVPLNGRPVLAYSLDAAQSAESVDAIVVVAGSHLFDAVTSLRTSGNWSKVIAVVVGGERRQDSVAAGLAALPAETALVAIHDAARPLVTPRLFDHTLMTALNTGAAIAAIPVADTLKRVTDNLVVETVSREGLWAAQTPQSFDLATLLRAFAVADAEGLNVTDEASLFERLGIAVAIVPGSPANLKITHPADLAIASALVTNRE